MKTEDKLLLVAKNAAQNATKVINGASRTNQTVSEKVSRFDIVTRVDLDSEKEIVSIIRKNYPGHNIISEEKGLLNNGSQYTWVIDPLDGTSLFVAGIPEYCVSIGLLKNNQPHLGVISKVATGEIYWSVRGRGAFKNGKSVQVNKISEYSQAIIASDYQNTKEQRIRDHERNAQLMIDSQKFRTGLGTVNSLTELIEGKLGGFVNYCRPWDFVAGAALVVEAGGKVSDWSGKEIDWTKEWIEAVFSNGLLHDKLVEKLAETKIT